MIKEKDKYLLEVKMPEIDCRREGVRVAVNNVDQIEAIIYTEHGVPEFCDEYEINLGGIKVNAFFNTTHDTNVKVSLFDNDNNRLEIPSTIVSSSMKNSIIKFGPLNKQQYDILRSMLTLQQPIEE